MRVFFLLLSISFLAVSSCATENEEKIIAKPTYLSNIINCDKPYQYNFKVSSTGSNGNVDYIWEFGDGQTGEGVDVIHAYASVGEYNVKLEARDNTGSSSIRNDILSVTGCSISGTINVQKGSAIDSDVNDPSAPYISNDQVDSAQAIQNPVVVGGFASAAGSGITADRFSTVGDPVDVYRATLAKNQSINLSISDFTPGNPTVNDLDLFLFNTNDLVNPVATSIDTLPTEAVIVPETGDYLVIVSAISGISNYMLAIGQTSNASSLASAQVGGNSDNYLRLENDFVEDELIIRFSANKIALTKANSFDSANINIGVQAVAGRSDAPMLFNLGQAAARKNSLSTLGVSSKQILLPNLVDLSDKLQKKFEVIKAVKKLRARSDVISVDLNYIRKPLLSPNDTHYTKQWHYPLINLPRAWDITTGGSATRDIIVAVVDTGIVNDHPDIVNKLVSGFDFIRNDNSSGDGDPGIDNNPDDPGDGATPGASSFHGTHVAGTIAAETNNNSGVAGISWEAKIMPIRVLGSLGGTSFDVMQGVRFAAGLSNTSNTVPTVPADIINLSLGGGGFSQSEQDVFQEVRSAGVIVIAASGNDAVNTLSYPASYNGVISVSAVGIQKSLAPYSNFGSAIDVTAPGGDFSTDLNFDGFVDAVLSTAADDSTGQRVTNFRFYQGTSMASPHVAGVVALMKSVYLDLTPDILDGLLESGAITEDIAANGASVRDDKFGYGLIDALKAVQVATSLNTGLELPGALSISPNFLNFENFRSTISFSTSNSGQQPLKISSVTSDAPWLSINPTSVDANNLGTYLASVDRSNLVSGIYSANVTFITDSAGSVDLPVTMIVGNLGSSTDNIGLLWLLLIDADTNTTIRAVPLRNELGNSYFFNVDEIGSGNYTVVAGTDSDNDGFVCDAGEACGANPTLSQLSIIPLSSSSITGMNFSAGFNILLNTSNLLNGNNFTDPSTNAQLQGFSRFISNQSNPSKNIR